MLDKVREIISDVTGLSPDEILENDCLIDDLGLDGLDIAEICAGIEDEFDIEMPDVLDIETTVSDLLDMIEERL
jgi:acyl carrier protein